MYTPEHYQRYKKVIDAAKERYRKKNMDKWRQAAKELTWEYRTIYSIKTRCKKKGLAFDLTQEDLVVPEICPVLGYKLTKSGGMNDPCSASIDRHDNTKGYTKDNIRIISLRANSLKRDATIEEMEKILIYMKN